MDAEDTNPRRHTRTRLIAIIGTAALAIPGGVAVSNALAADGAGSATDSTTAPIQQSRDERPDGRDCPEKDGGGETTAPSTGASTEQTAL